MIIPTDYYNFDRKQVIELVQRVASETAVDPLKVNHIIEQIEDLQDAKNVRGLIEVLAHCP